MKKTVKTILLTLALGISLAGGAAAATYSFNNLIDNWGPSGAGAAWIGEDCPLSYTHDINDEVDFSAGDLVTEAFLELDFTNDLIDGYGGLWVFRWDFREYASYAIDGSGDVHDLGEVDNQNFSGLFLNVDWLNDDGLLDVTVSVSNLLGTAAAWLDHSRLYGTASTAPVPEPATLLLMGTGLLAFGCNRFRKQR